jgi:hypothetical protein
MGYRLDYRPEPTETKPVAATSRSAIYPYLAAYTNDATESDRLRSDYGNFWDYLAFVFYFSFFFFSLGRYTYIAPGLHLI